MMSPASILDCIKILLSSYSQIICEHVVKRSRDLFQIYSQGHNFLWNAYSIIYVAMPSRKLSSNPQPPKKKSFSVDWSVVLRN